MRVQIQNRIQIQIHIYIQIQHRDTDADATYRRLWISDREQRSQPFYWSTLHDGSEVLFLTWIHRECLCFLSMSVFSFTSAIAFF